MTIARFFERVLSQPAPGASPAHDSTTFVRETFYPARTDLLELLAALHEARLTGRLILDISQGSVNAIRVREELNCDWT
jgi:hypothetical protein